MSDDVSHNLKNKGDCGCGCGKFATFRVKPWASNGVLCVRTCNTCRQCKGRQSKKGGQKDQQQKGAKLLGIQRAKNDEQADRAAFRWENKRTNRRGVSGPVHTAWDNVEKVDEALRPHGDNRPFIARFSVDDRPYGLVVMRDDHLDETLYALCLQRGISVP